MTSQAAVYHRSQLPEEAKKFDIIDKTFKKIMQETVKNPKIKDCCHAENRLSDLQNLSEGLEKCQKSLNDYVDSKRNAFPRYVKKIYILIIYSYSLVILPSLLEHKVITN